MSNKIKSVLNHYCEVEDILDSGYHYSKTSAQFEGCSGDITTVIKFNKNTLELDLQNRKKYRFRTRVNGDGEPSRSLLDASKAYKEGLRYHNNPNPVRDFNNNKKKEHKKNKGTKSMTKKKVNNTTEEPEDKLFFEVEEEEDKSKSKEIAKNIANKHKFFTS